jgi:hypothetical protein
LDLARLSDRHIYEKRIISFSFQSDNSSNPS